MNVPPMCGLVISRGLATLHQLSTVYGTEDLWDLREVILVDAHNRRSIDKALASKRA